MMRTRQFVVVLALVFAADRPLAQQAPPSATGFISGQVVEGGSTRPVPGATVTISFVTPRGQARQVIADGKGRYVFSGLPAGEFRLSAAKPGWRAGAFGLDRPAEGIAPGGDVLTLAPGGRATASVPVWRPALISGRVTDEAGQPLAGARVSAVRWTAMRGRRNLQSQLTVTDDRGQFTLSVQPGEFMITAISEQVRNLSGRPHAFRQTFYPRTPATSGSTTVTVRSGDERNGIDIQLPLEPVFRVTGVLNRTDAGTMPARVEAVRVDTEVPRQIALRPVDAQGRFAFDNLPAGRYLLHTLTLSLAEQDPSRNQELWARVPFDITDRDLDLAVDLRRRLLVSGRISFDGSAPVPAGGVSIGVRLFREEELPLTDVVPGYAPVGADGRFTLAVPPGRYVISSGVSVQSMQELRNGLSAASAATRAWTMRTGTYAGRDAADVPIAVTSDVSGLDLTFTDRPPVLRGRVTSRQGSVEANQLLVFPAEDSLWSEFAVGRRFRATRLPADGSFELRNFPEGVYFVAAVRSTPQDFEAWRNPAFLEVLARSARRVTLIEGQTTTQDVELAAAPVVSAMAAPLPVVLEPTDRAVVRERAANAASGATIAGVVVASGSNAPIRGARVGITPGVGGAANIGGAYTDDQGRFVLGEVPAGQHTLYVSQPSFVSTTFGALQPGEQGTPVTVANGQQMSGLTIPMVRGAAIGGTVVDHNGQPLPNVQVSVRAYRWTARGRELVAPRAPTIFGAATTNQRGEYRAYGLAPGDYIIQASPQGVATAIPLTTQAVLDAAARPSSAGTAEAQPAEVIQVAMFYPNTPDAAAAQTVRVEAGDDRTIDFQLRLIPTATISGTVRTPDGSPADRLGLNLIQNESPAPPSPRSRFGSTDANGAFTMRGIPPGRYVLTTSGASVQSIAPTRTFTGTVELFVDRDMTGVVLDVGSMATVAGRVRGEVPAALRQPNVRISLSPLPGTVVPPNLARSAVIGADNGFSIPNVPPGRYRFELTGPNTVARPRVASQLVNGIDTSDAGLEVKGGEVISTDVELTTSEARVSGLVRDRAGQPVPRATIVLFPRDSQLWAPPSRRIFGVRPDQNGRYAFPDVPAGEYLIAVLNGAQDGEWFDPKVLGQMAAGATLVTVRRGDALEIGLETR